MEAQPRRDMSAKKRTRRGSLPQCCGIYGLGAVISVESAEKIVTWFNNHRRLDVTQHRAARTRYAMCTMFPPPPPPPPPFPHTRSPRLRACVRTSLYDLEICPREQTVVTYFYMYQIQPVGALVPIPVLSADSLVSPLVFFVFEIITYIAHEHCNKSSFGRGAAAAVVQCPAWRGWAD